MTPEQKIKWAIILSSPCPDDLITAPITKENVDDIWEKFRYYFYDAEDCFRDGEVETNIPCESSRLYESQSVAAEMPDGTWVGWTYWYGGGKHGEPESIDWMGEAYHLNCVAEEKLVVVRTFTKKGE